jgi:DNA-binding SARP family transcriptional activator
MAILRGVASRSAFERVRSALPRFIAVTAPAGFGKTHLVQACFGAGGTIVCDAREASDLPRFIVSLRAAGRSGKRERGALDPQLQPERALFDAWRTPADAGPIVIDRAEALLAFPEALDLVKRLLAAAHPSRRIVVCGRRSVRMDDAAIALPHETAAFGAVDLALDRASIRVLLEPSGNATRSDAVWALSEGWPAAVLFLRTCAQDGTLAAVLADPGGPEAARFHAYVEREVFAEASPAQREVAFACATSASVGAAELARLLGAAVTRNAIDEFSLLGLLHQLPNGTCALHPLLAATLRALHPERIAEATRRLAGLIARTEPLRAAPLLAAMGDAAGAEHAYAHATPYDLEGIDFENSTRAASFDRETLLDNLALFVAASQADYHEIDVDDWLAQAQEALRRSDGRASPETRQSALLMVTNRFALAGRWNDGHAFLASQRRAAPGDHPQERARFLLLAAILDAAGDRPVDLASLRDELGNSLANGYTRGLFARRVASAVASLHGRSAETLRELEIAYERATAYGRTPYALEIAMLACFEAWRDGDDDAVARWYERIVGASGYRTNAAATLFLAALDGHAAPDAAVAETAATRARACLIAASQEDDATEALRWLERAMHAAERTRRPLTLALVHVAIACVDPRRAAAALGTAAAIAAATPSTELQRAVQAIVDGSEDRGMLAAFVERFSHVAAPHGADLELRVAEGTVRWHDREVALEERPFSVLCALALAGRALAQDEVTELLWPDRPAGEMGNALRVHLSAIRKALAKDAVVHERGSYRLQCSVRVDLVVYESLVRAVDRRGALRDGDRSRLRSALQALDAHVLRDAHLELTLGITPRIAALRSRVLEILAGDALAAERYAEALHHARAAQAIDRYDDRSAQILVTALWRTGHRAAAVRAFREHEELLRRELGVEPSSTLDDLVNGSG